MSARAGSPPDPIGGEQAASRHQVAAPQHDEATRVTTLELFFDLVFAFTLTQLSAVLADHTTWGTAGRVLLVFGLLWWMYQAYAWLTNARPPVHTPERLLLLLGMAGFLVIGIAIPSGFARYGVVLGLGYLVVVLVHSYLYYRVNANIVRIAPFNIASALLVTAAGFSHGPGGSTDAVGYGLWIAALTVQLGSPLVVHPKGLFEVRSSHFTERHSALLIIAIGESVAAVGVGAAGPAGRAVSWHLLASAVLGLAVAAALWWIIFGSGDEQRAERMLAAATSERRTTLALNAFFYGNIPLFLGLIAIAAGILRAVVQAAGQSGAEVGASARAAQSIALACGATLFLAGDVIIRRQLGTGPILWRTISAVAALATAAIGAFAGLNPQLIVVLAILITPLIVEPGASPGRPGIRDTDTDESGGPGGTFGQSFPGSAGGTVGAEQTTDTAGEGTDRHSRGDAAG